MWNKKNPNETRTRVREREKEEKTPSKSIWDIYKSWEQKLNFSHRFLVDVSMNRE